MTSSVPPRIGIAGFSCECSTFSPSPTEEGDFISLMGEELLAEYPFLTRYPDCEFVPLHRARALPGGPIDPAFYQRFKRQLLMDLAERGPWDGLFLHLHGAANVQGSDDLEGDLLAAIRRVTGPGCLISASYDLHGNISPRAAVNLDILTAYRTAPHVDWRETVERACSLLIRCLRENLRPVLEFIPVPILLPGEQTSTEFEPAAALYGKITEVVTRHALLDASILIGYVWADEPRATGSVVAVGLDPERTRAAAIELAGAFWGVREQFRFGVPTGAVDECIDWARGSAAEPVIISDSGDNPTAGGVGDIPFVLGRLLELEVDRTLLVGLADAEAVSLCRRRGEGAELSLDLGGKLDPVNGTPLTVKGTVVSLHSVPRSTGTTTDPLNQMAVVQVAGICVVITRLRTPFHHLDDFSRLGLDPGRFKIIVVKIGYLVPELRDLAKESYLALSPGAVNQDILRLSYERIGRPMFPFDREMEWDPRIGPPG